MQVQPKINSQSAPESPLARNNLPPPQSTPVNTSDLLESTPVPTPAKIFDGPVLNLSPNFILEILERLKPLEHLTLSGLSKIDWPPCSPSAAISSSALLQSQPPPIPQFQPLDATTEADSLLTAINHSLHSLQTANQDLLQTQKVLEKLFEQLVEQLPGGTSSLTPAEFHHQLSQKGIYLLLQSKETMDNLKKVNENLGTVFEHLQIVLANTKIATSRSGYMSEVD